MADNIVGVTRHAWDIGDVIGSALTCRPFDWIKKKKKSSAAFYSKLSFPTVRRTNQSLAWMPLVATETKVIVFTDFDGTITLNDSNGIVTRRRLELIRLFGGQFGLRRRETDSSESGGLEPQSCLSVFLLEIYLTQVILSVKLWEVCVLPFQNALKLLKKVSESYHHEI